jgi:hypothetical protein
MMLYALLIFKHSQSSQQTFSATINVRTGHNNGANEWKTGNGLIVSSRESHKVSLNQINGVYSKNPSPIALQNNS